MGYIFNRDLVRLAMGVSTMEDGSNSVRKKGWPSWRVNETFFSSPSTSSTHNMNVRSVLSLSVCGWTKLEKDGKVRHNMTQIASLLAVATVFIGLWTLFTSQRGGRNRLWRRYGLELWPWHRNGNGRHVTFGMCARRLTMRARRQTKN